MGEVFAGRFELVEPIAEGGMGSVWVVRDHRDGRTYAGKLLRQSDSASLLRFMREQSTRIQHPHVVTPLSWAGEDDRVLFTMAWVRGGSVADLLRRSGRLERGLVAHLLLQAVRGLEAVHAAGVVHRDVKPGNLLLDPRDPAPPHLLLTDFGISARVDEPRLTQAHQVIGSPGYMAPEQRAGADPAFAQDVYAVGMVGLEMLTGVRPPGSVDHARALEKLERDPLRALLLEAVAEDPARRPTVARLGQSIAALGLTAPEATRLLTGPDVRTAPQVPPVPAAPPDAATQRATRVEPRAASAPSARRPGPPWAAVAWLGAGIALLVAAALVGLLG